MISNPNPTAPDAGHRADLKLSASKMRGAVRRAFQAAMAVNDCAGSPRQTESVFGWSCHAVELGLHERRTGLVCLSVQSAFGGDNLWEEKHPAAAVLWELAEAHSQRDPTFRTTQSFTRLAAAEALRQLRARHRRGRAAVTEYDGRGPGPQRLPAASGARGQTPKKVPQTDAIFDNLRAKDQCGEDGHVARLSIDCKATVKIGEYSRGGCARGDTKAADHGMGCHETYTPFGLANEDTGVLHLTFGRSAKTSDCIVDGLHAWWEQQPPEQRERITLVRIKAWLLTVADIRDWTSPNAAGRACTVASIHDGDTLRAVCDGERLQVRLYCIDAPEMSQAPRGRESRDHLRGMIPGQVTIRFHDTDRYGRRIGEIVSADGTNLNLAMVLAGQAAVYPRYCGDPRFFAAEREARSGGLGIWSSTGDHQRPWDHRRGSE